MSDLVGLGKVGKWIDGFQQRMSIPVATRIAQFARVPLIDFRMMIQAGSENKLLMVVLGPFQFEHDANYSWWHGFKVFVHNQEIASALCRLDNKGNGGFSAVKLWDIYEDKFIYHGDPSQERTVRSEKVVQLTTELLASQHKVGFVEDQSLAITPQQTREATQQIQKNPYAHITEDELREWQSKKRV